jgi:predicted phosphodiesterase
LSERVYTRDRRALMQKIEGPWREEVKAMKNAGKSWNEIAKEIPAKYPDVFAGMDYGQCFERVRQATRRDEKQQQPVNVQEALMTALGKGTTAKAFAESVGITESIATVMIDEIKRAGFNVQLKGDVFKIEKAIPPTENVVKKPWHGEKIIRFGLTGDSHINSKYTQLTHLHALYDIFVQEGITTVYHTGDIDDGEHMRIGHEYELYEHGADDHVGEIVRVYPSMPGIETDFITGNHDHAFIKGIGLDIGNGIAEKRKDMKYLGQSSAVIQLTDNCTLELRHPLDGTAYALSYKTQKMLDAMSGGEKPNILAIGHYHKAEYLFYRNVHAIQTGTTCAQTPWMKGKQIAAHVGGWIVEIRVRDDGAIERINQEFIPFYRSIKDDWRGWR